MPTPNDSYDIDRNQIAEPSVEPTVGELLLARIDEHCRLLALELKQVAKACEQLAPERARSCRNAITMASVMVDEVRLRAHTRPLHEPNREAYVPAAVRVASPSGRSPGCSPLPGTVARLRCNDPRRRRDLSVNDSTPAGRLGDRTAPFGATPAQRPSGSGGGAAARLWRVCGACGRVAPDLQSVLAPAKRHGVKRLPGPVH
jgi:hypothetical protein